MDLTVSILMHGNQFLGSIEEGLISNLYLNHFESVSLLFALSFTLMSYYTRSKLYLTFSMILFIGQGFYHSFIGIQHNDCIEVVYKSNSTTLQEIYVGRKAIVLNSDPDVGYQIRKQRKLHMIHLLQNYK